MQIILTPLIGIPLINPGDDLVEIVLGVLSDSKVTIEDSDIFVFTQKIVSKSEDRYVNLTTVTPSESAINLANKTSKDPRLVELILQESNEVIRIREGLIIVEHRLGFICANAGIDHSNVKGQWGNHEDWVLLLPEDPDLSSMKIRKRLELKIGNKLGVMIIDSHGRAWRRGTVGVCIGLSGLPGLVDLRGEKDLFDYELRVTEVGAADELAAAASLVMGQVAEATPVVHVHGFPYSLRESSLSELIRSKKLDMFR